MIDLAARREAVSAVAAAVEGGRDIDADVILWAAGFRHALGHLAPRGLRGCNGGLPVEGTHVAGDPRNHLLGYGPSASTIGANRAAHTAVRDLRRYLDRPNHAAGELA
jgi:hypothetical protein